VQALRLLLRRPENAQCADCAGGGRPAWASINCGVFICLSCAGLHRGLGVHVSQARAGLPSLHSLMHWPAEPVLSQALPLQPLLPKGSSSG